MLSLRISKLCRQFHYPAMFPHVALIAHTESCPTKKKAPPATPKCPPVPTKEKPKGPVCPGTGGGGSSKITLKRAPASGKVRMGFIPEEWFLFFHSKTGVTGPYVFGIMLTNYLVSKEFYVMEHEYYTGLSIFVIIYYASTNFGPTLGAELDKEVDAVAAALEKTRTDEMAFFEDTIKMAKDAQWRAEGQRYLMDAKKENVAMQLEAAYRERMMQVYKTVKGRMDYHVKLYRAQARIQQKWMLQWILGHVMKSITPELEKQALTRAIEDLATAASRGK